MTKDTIFSTKTVLNCGGKLINLNSPIVMGIVNTTPDSFYKNSRKQTQSDILHQVESMLSEGASILDFGGYSTRPGSSTVSEDEELKRVIPAISSTIKAHPQAIISIDTFRSQVARQAIEAGATIVNDISGGTLDKKMYDVVAQYRVPYIMMHIKGNPQTMHTRTSYDNLLIEVMDFFIPKITQLRAMNVADIILDLGFGFAKNLNQNFELLQNLSYFNRISLPLLVGLSRKSMVYRTLGNTAEEALNGTTVLHTIALMNGAKVLRVHDVKEAVEAIKLYNATYR